MPFIRVDWSKEDSKSPMVFPGVFSDGLPRVESDVVLHAAKVTYGVGSTNAPRSYTQSAIAWAEVTHVDAVSSTVLAPPREWQGDERYMPLSEVRRAVILSTRLHLRSGGDIIILHPFTEIEPLFRAYHTRHEKSEDSTPAGLDRGQFKLLSQTRLPHEMPNMVEGSAAPKQPRFYIYDANSKPRMYVMCEIHDELEFTDVRSRAMEFSKAEADRLTTKYRDLARQMGGSLDYRLEEVPTKPLSDEVDNQHQLLQSVAVSESFITTRDHLRANTIPVRETHEAGVLLAYHNGGKRTAYVQDILSGEITLTLSRSDAFCMSVASASGVVTDVFKTYGLTLLCEKAQP